MASTSHNPTSPTTPWHVFLSFRGKDTRYTFTDHLYQALKRTAIRTFRDDPELRSGIVLSDSLIQAIHESKIYIVVFSENYATSSWCLKELVEILACYKRMKRLVIPVFYRIDPSVIKYPPQSFQEDIDPPIVRHQTASVQEDIDPSVIRQQTASVQEAFVKHQTRFHLEEVNKWRSTLNEVGGISGYHIPENSSEAAVIDKITERVLQEITPITLNVAEFPVGLDSRVKDVAELFNTVKEGVNRIGIYGMGGVGKTTLAKAVYNQNYRRFSGSCFLADVREVSRTKGLACLQQQLINDVLKPNKKIEIDNVDQGIEVIRARICSTTVLVVIDDLDNSDHLRYLEGPFALGSVVIITTRNEILLDDIGVKAKYMVNEMSEDESHKLFAQHAFREDKIPDRFAELSREILKRVGDLPLALAVCGSALFNKPEEGWNWYICRLKEAPITGVEEKLMISFDALKLVDPDLQNIFLDIACFCIGINNDMVFRIMESCYEYVPYRIDILKKRCLITVSEHGDLRMHDLLCDMGRNIARNNCPDKPGKHSRLWVSKDIDTVLDDHKGTKAIQGIIPEKFSLFYYNYIGAREVKFDAESFKRMSDLRLLYLNNVNITGSFKKKFEKLRWLCWEYCPLECLPSEFYPQKLVTLELRCSKMKAVWDPNMVPGVLEKLKSLNMQRSSNLTTTPDFTRLPCLQTLDLSGCVSLKEVHVSIGSLASLVSLDLGHCENLRSLPDSICSLRALKVLNIDYCKSLKALPTELGNIVSLKVLKASNLCVSKLPYSIGRLGNLVKLHLRSNENLETLPHSICKLRSLQILDICYCKKLEELPDQLGMITSLRNLRVSGLTMLKKIPDISQLSNIEDLDLTDCHHLLSIVELPPNLNSLSMRECRSLETVPDLSNLKQLEKLHLRDCKVLIKGLEELTCLRQLFLDEWSIGLLCRRAGGCTSLKRLLNLSNFKQLEELSLVNSSGLTEIKGLQELTCLRQLNLDACRGLLSISELPPNLQSIRVGYCTSLKRLPNLSHLKQLEDLNLTDCSCLTEIKGLEELTCLQQLKIFNCCGLLSISELPPNLKSISAQGCTSLKRLPNLSHLKQLEDLDICDCSGLEELTCLRQLEIFDCGDLLSISELPPNLQSIRAEYCTSLKRLPNLSNLKQLQNLHLKGCSGLTEIKGLEELTCLRKLNLDGCIDLLSISELPPNLKCTRAPGCTSLKRLPNLSNLKQLKDLNLTDCSCLAEIKGLEELTCLRQLNLDGCIDLLSISELSPNLKSISARGCTSLETLPDLSNLKQLEKLNLEDCSGLTEIKGPEELTSLKYLNLKGCNSSLVESTLKIPFFFQILSGFGHAIRIQIGSFEFEESGKVFGSRMSFDLQPSASYNLMGIIFCFSSDVVTYSIKHIRSGFEWSDVIKVRDYAGGSVIVIVPSSDFSIEDGHNTLEVISNSDEEISCGIHLLYETEIKMISEHKNGTMMGKVTIREMIREVTIRTMRKVKESSLRNIIWKEPLSM